ncbi:MAG: HEAT repeat domain-containing protein [Candidatus Heimdallarchaeota archaeon]
MQFENLESSDKDTRKSAAIALGNVRTKSSLRALLDAAKNDLEKDVRKAAIDSITSLGDPEAIPVLEQISIDDKDRGTRNKARDAVDAIRASGISLPESEDYSESDADRARSDFRALEEHEKGQSGLKVRLQETIKYRIDRENNLVNLEGEKITSLTGTGKLEIANTGKKDRIWGIDAELEGVENVLFDADIEQGTAVFDDSFALKELNPSEAKSVPFTFDLPAPQVLLVEHFWDSEKTDSPPIFSRGEEASMRFTIEVANQFDWPLKNVIIKKYILDGETRVNNFETTTGTMTDASDDDGHHLFWEIEEIPANSKVNAGCNFTVILPEGTNEPYRIGSTLITYHGIDNNLSGVNLKTITGSSSVFQFISREEQEENPGDFDCRFELENTSEFEMDLKTVRIYEGPLDDGNIRIEWLGRDFPEEERSIDPGETFTLDPWTITVDEPDNIPQFGRELDLSVKYLFDSEIVAEVTLAGYALPFMAIEVEKAYNPLEIPSYRRTEVMSGHTIKSIGSTEIEYLKLVSKLPEGFEGPERENIQVVKGDMPLEDFYAEVSSEAVTITMEHLEESPIGPFAQGEEIEVKYPIYTTAKPNEEFMGSVIVYGNIYPEIKPITAETEAGPITVIHQRRKLKIGKMVSSTASEDPNEYEIIIRGENDGTAIIRNVEITDFLPAGFELASDTEEDPPVGFEDQYSVQGGRAMKWVFGEVSPGQKVHIRFKIKAPGDHDPKDVYRMLLG